MELSRAWENNFDYRKGVPCAQNQFKTKLVYEPEFSTNLVHKRYVDCVRFYGNLIISKSQDGSIVV